jgi:hypothetical protein
MREAIPPLPQHVLMAWYLVSNTDTKGLNKGSILNLSLDVLRLISRSQEHYRSSYGIKVEGLLGFDAV